MNPITAWMLMLSTLHLELATGYTEWADWLIDVSERIDAGGAQES